MNQLPSNASWNKCISTSKLCFLLLCLSNFALASNQQSTTNWLTDPQIILPPIESNISQVKSINNSLAPNSKKLNQAQVQIGASFFEYNESAVFRHPISQIGITYEARDNVSDSYIFFNQLLVNQIFYEVRAWGIYNYVTANQNRLLPSTDVSNQANPLGYGFTGILGYNFEVSKNLSILPYLRSDYFYDFATVYRDSDGNAINSITYNEFIGTKLSLRATDELALYINYWLGYQLTQYLGSGIFNNGSSPATNGFVTTMEFGAPYKISRNWNLTPYIQYTTTAPNPNSSAASSPYNVSSNTVTNQVYAIRFSYNF